MRAKHAAPRIGMKALITGVRQQFVRVVGWPERTIDSSIGREAFPLGCLLEWAEDGLLHLGGVRDSRDKQVPLRDTVSVQLGMELERAMDHLHLGAMLKCRHGIVQAPLGQPAIGADDVAPEFNS